MISTPTIIHIKFDSVIRRDHDLLSAGLNLIRSEERGKRQDVRMIVNAYLLLRGTIQELRTARKGQTVINK